MHPILLIGGALVTLPILLHLILKQEPKRLPFPALRFLQLKKKISQRKLRLKQWLLLALRCLLIALFALALYQPRLTGGGFAGLADEQPAACVLVIDTSPSMGYSVGGVTRLADARKRALELLDELSAGSKVAVIDPADPAVQWEPTVGDARRRLEGLLDPHGGGPPLITGLAAAYQLLRTADEDQAEPLPKLVAIFTDRAAACWPADRTADLKALATQLPPPEVRHLVVDVGADAPANVSILDLIAKPPSGPAGQPITLTTTLKSLGGDVDAEAELSVDDGPATRQAVRLPAGQPVAVRFPLAEVPKGLHQAKVTIRDDALAADNVRHVTFKVGDARRILTVCDNPDDAGNWALAHEVKGEFEAVVKKPDDATDFARYEFVTLLSVADPARPLADGKSLWDRLAPYLRTGGKLLVVPGGDPATAKSYARPELPGTFTKLADAALESGQPNGVAWNIDDAAERQPLLANFREWRLANVGFLKSPRRTLKYWAVEAPSEAVVVRYDDKEARPAVLEKELPGGGRVVLLTSRMDNQASDPNDKWNDNWTLDGTDWPTVWPHRLAVHLAGASTEAVFTFPTGQPVTVTLPKGGLPKGAKLALEGPGVGGPDASQPLADGQTEWRLPPALSLAAGSFRLRAADWQDGFSLNPPADEFDLNKVPSERIEEVTGAGTVAPVGKAVSLREVLSSRLGGEVNLFPWLLIGVLLLFAGEGLLANRFYRR